MLNGPSKHKKPIRVLQVISSPEMGGIENQLLFFLQRYDRSRLVVDVVCTDSTAGALEEAYTATHTKLILCKWSRYVVPFVLRLYWLLRKNKYDVIHARMSEVSGAAMIAAFFAGVTIRISSYHHTEIRWQRPGLLNSLAVKTLQKINLLLATRILSISENCLDVYYSNWRKHNKKFEICYNGIDLNRFSLDFREQVREELGLPSDVLVVGHVGSFREAKNHEVIIDIAELVSLQMPEVKFILVGDGALRASIESEVKRRSLADNFLFTGNRMDVPRMLGAMDIFLMPSLHEGFGTVAIEAQATGLPVAASDLACIREALCPKMHQYCKEANDAEGMAEDVMMLLRDSNLRYRLGREGREYVSSKFSIDRAVKQLERVYDLARS